MNILEQKLGSDKIRLGSDGNGIFLAVLMRGSRWVLLTSEADVLKRKIALIREHGAEHYGLMLAYICGETSVPAAVGKFGYVNAKQV